MVEGPGATRNGRKVQRALHRTLLSTNIPDNNLAADLVNKHLIEAFTIGKELFLIFSSSPYSTGYGDEENEDEIAIRLHFGMNGCLYVYNAKSKSSGVPPWRKGEETFQLCFGEKMKETTNKTDDGKRQCTISPSLSNHSSPADNIIDLISGDEEDDVVSSRGKKRRSSPGVSPPKKQKITTIPIPTSLEVSLIVEARATTLTGPFPSSKPRSRLTRLSNHDICSSCFHAPSVFTTLRNIPSPTLNISDAILHQDYFPGVGNIIKVESLHRAGVDPRRVTKHLTDVELRRVIRHCREFSLKWLDNGKTPTKLVYNKSMCGTCGKTSVCMQKLGGGDSGDGRGYMARVTFWCVHCQPAEGQQRREGISACENNSFGSQSVGGAAMLPMQGAFHKHTTRKTNSVSSIATPPTLSQPQQQTSSSYLFCPIHGEKHTILRRVRKTSSPNLYRIFRTCKASQKGGKCTYFAWADSHFPTCKCSKRAVLRVSKTHKSGGRWFFSCVNGGGSGANGNRNGCGLFDWAKEDQLAPFGSLLTPLL